MSGENKLLPALPWPDANTPRGSFKQFEFGKAVMPFAMALCQFCLLGATPVAALKLLLNLAALILLIFLMSGALYADTIKIAEARLEKLKEYCYSEIDDDEVVDQIISIDNVLTTLRIGRNAEQLVYVVNPQHLICNGHSAGLCGTRGCSISIISNNTALTYTGWEPKVIREGNDYLLLLPHTGLWCGASFNAAPCYSILFWDDTENRLSFIKESPIESAGTR